MSILKQLASNNYISVNKTLIKLFGLEESVLLGELCSEYDYWEKNDKLEDGLFYSTISNIEENTGLSEYQQRSAIQSLKNCGVLETIVKGLPAKRYFKINEDKLIEFLQTSSLKIQELDTEKSNLNNNITNKNNKKHTNSINTISRDFLGSANKVDKPKKQNRYSKCMDMINKFTDNSKVRELLITYLNFRLELKDKPLYANQWKGMLNKLSELCGADINSLCEVIQQSIDRGYLSFFPVSSYSKRDSKQPSFDHTNYRSVDDDYYEEELRWQEEMNNNGQTTEF